MLFLMDVPPPPPPIYVFLTKEQMVDRAIRTIKVSRSEARCSKQIAYKESRYDSKSLNKSSGARGAWQLMWGKPNWSIFKQIQEANDYVEHRYGSWCQAYKFHQERNWY